ncbi:MAG: flavin reductase family protein [Gammaproteobacteria bacterium]|nr:flavin reductase family protein [Gammaproteobacteria bacterium]
MFREIDIKDLDMNVFNAFANEWALVTAKTQEGANSMTISWGEMGSLWNNNKEKHVGGLPICTVFVRPQRHTRKFIDKASYYTVSFFRGKHMKELGIYGSKSGKDIDKDKAANFHLISEGDYAYYEEAEVSLICKLLYSDDLKEENFIDKNVVEVSYPRRDFHRFYIGEIIKVLVKE